MRNGRPSFVQRRSHGIAELAWRQTMAAGQVRSAAGFRRRRAVYAAAEQWTVDSSRRNDLRAPRAQPADGVVRLPRHRLSKPPQQRRQGPMGYRVETGDDNNLARDTVIGQEVGG